MATAARDDRFASVDDIRTALRLSVEQTLEIMCFAEATPADAPAEGCADWLTAQLESDGDVDGVFQLGLCLQGARLLAASFLAWEGEGEDAEVGRVVCELANIVCGSMLTRLDPGASFTLTAPRLIEGRTADGLADPAAVDFTIEDDALLWCSFHVGEP